MLLKGNDILTANRNRLLRNSNFKPKKVKLAYNNNNKKKN